MTINRQADLSTPHNFKKSILGLLVTFICAIFLAGCSGGSGGSGGFVASPSGNAVGGGNAGNGSVTFNFLRAQNEVTVPLTTTSLRIEFFSGLGGTGAIVKSDTVPFASTVTIEGVPSSARSSVVTALTAEGFPLLSFVVSTPIVANGNVVVDGTTGTSTPVTVQTVVSTPVSLSLTPGGSALVTAAANFSNGDTVSLGGALASFVTFAPTNPAVATVDALGNVTAVANGSTTITADFQGQQGVIPVAVGGGLTGPPSTVSALAVSIVGGPSLNLPVGASSNDPLVVTATFADTSTRVLTASEVNFTTTNGAVASVNSDTGVIVVSPTATAGQTATLSASFMGTASPNIVTVTVDERQLTGIVVAPETVSLPFGGFETQLAVTGQFSDGSTQALANDPMMAPILTFNNNGSALFTVTGDGLVTTAATGTAGGEAVSVTATQGATTVPGTRTITVGQVTATDLIITPPNPSLIRGAVQEFMVEAILSDTNRVDVSDFAALVLTSNSANVVVNGKQAVAVNATPMGTPATLTFSIAGATQTTLVTVLEQTLVSVVYRFGGIDIPANNTVNLPRGYVGIFEVIGTFNTGDERKLTPGEFTVTPEAEANGNNGAAIQTFDNTYQQLVGGEPAGTGGYARVRPELFDDMSTNPGMVDDVSDDLLFGDVTPDPRAIAVATSPTDGSDNTTVRVRETFKGVVSDWRQSGSVIQPATNVFALDDPTFDSAFSQRNFTISIDAGLIDAINNPISDQVVSVTTVDPLTVTVVSADFVNYAADDFVALNTVREFEVRVDFSASTGNPGFQVEAITGFKLAEANVAIRENRYRQASTADGFVGIFAETEVANAFIDVVAIPITGAAAQFSVATAPFVDTNDTPGDLTDDNYVPGTYTDPVSNVFGVHSTSGIAEDPNVFFPAFDPGIDTGDGPPARSDARIAGAPADRNILTQFRGNEGVGIDVVTPLLFSLDPINSGGNVPIEIGASQRFRTLVRFQADEPIVDRSLDYCPTLFTSVATSGFLSQRTSDGNTLVSAVALMTPNVVSGDVDTISGNTLLAVNVDVAAAIGTAAGFVVALDAVGNPIEEKGSFVTGGEDQLMQTGPGQNITTVEAVAAP